jgi:hypothetical protein
VSYTGTDDFTGAISAAFPNLAQALHVGRQKQSIVTLLSRIVHCRRLLKFIAAASAPTKSITSGKIPVLMRRKGALGSD